MSFDPKRLEAFVDYVEGTLKGDEKGEGHIFCEHFLQAFGHAGVKEIGAVLEERIQKAKGKGTKFADLVWRPKDRPGVLLELKKRGEKLQKHYQQVFEYWERLVPNRPRYVILCNFDEFWIYNFDIQLDEPLDRVSIHDLPKRHGAFAFLYPKVTEPYFKNNLVQVTRNAAHLVTAVFKRLVHPKRQPQPVPREAAQKFILRCVVCMFAEDIKLLPDGFFVQLLKDCHNADTAYDLLTGLFRQMASEKPAPAGRFSEVRYFNGGLFRDADAVNLGGMERDLLIDAANEDWSKVNPAIFGTLFEDSMDAKERHAFGAEFTSEHDIMKVVNPTIIRPWREQIEAAGNNTKKLIDLHNAMLDYQVLDPACGSGNFLYLAYRHLKRLETDLLDRIDKKDRNRIARGGQVSTKQFFGIEIQHFAVELAKVGLMIAKKLAIEEQQAHYIDDQFNFELEHDLPLDNLDENIQCKDALFNPWPKADAIIGNPPYQSKNKMQQELGVEYVQKVRKAFPAVPGRADYCVYWFRKAHDCLAKGGRAGLVGTNTIRQNYSREGGLDYIVGNGGTITEAVSSQPWSGDAAVHVSIVNWMRGELEATKKLIYQRGTDPNGPVDVHNVDYISSSLSAKVDVTSASQLIANTKRKVCFQGQTHGHEGFLVRLKDVHGLTEHDRDSAKVIHPYMTGEELVGGVNPSAWRFVIDLQCDNIIEAGRYKVVLALLEKSVLPSRKAGAKAEEQRNAEVLRSNPKAKVNNHHRNFLNKWWQLSYPRSDLIQELAAVRRYCACSRVTKRQIFEFVNSKIRPNDKLTVFVLEDDYSFGIISSGLHWNWFTEKCTTLTERFNYNSDSVWNTFPWPQSPTLKQVRSVADAAVALRKLRREVMAKNKWSLRDLYRTLEQPGKNPLRDAQDELDVAVRAAYGMKAKDDPLAFLLALNHEVAAQEAKGEEVTAPGLPKFVKNPAEFITTDCIEPPKLTGDFLKM